MKKKVENGKKNYKKWIIIILSIFVMVFLIGFLSWLYYIETHPVYQIENRVSSIEKEKSKRKQKVEAWVRVQGTNIDYPVIYNTIDVNLGALLYDFAWTNVSDKKLGNRELVIGHNILNVSKRPLITSKNHHRFEQLASFMYYDFAKENQYIQYTINGENHLYKIFAAGFVEDSKLDASVKNLSKKELKQYIDTSRKLSFYRYSVDVDPSDHVLTLVTCTRFYGSNSDIVFRLDARKVRENEKILKYRVAESSKYDKIKEEMEGEEEYEEA